MTNPFGTGKPKEKAKPLPFSEFIKRVQERPGTTVYGRK